MERKFLFNYDALNDYLIEGQKNPNRTNGQLTLLRDNCKNNLANVLSNPKEYIITIDDSNGDITINGEKDLQEKFLMFSSSYGMDKKSRLYRQVKQALDEAKYRGIYDQVFKEIKEDK